MNKPGYYFNYKITFMCNQNCDYCYEMRDSKDIWNKYMLNKSDIKHDLEVFKSISRSTIEILGGEPLLSPWLKWMLEYCYENLDHQIAISTNATARKIQNLGLSIKVIRSVEWLLSWHGDNTDTLKFLENVEYLISCGAKPQINIMLNQEYDKVFMEYILDNLALDRIHVSLLPLWDATGMLEYHPEYNKIKEVITKKPQETLCSYNEMFIDRGTVTSALCLLESKEKFDFKFAKSLPEFKPRECPFDSCVVPNAVYCRPEDQE